MNELLVKIAPFDYCHPTLQSEIDFTFKVEFNSSEKELHVGHTVLFCDR